MAPAIEGMDISWRKFFKEINDPDFAKLYMPQFIEFLGAARGQVLAG